MKTKQLASLFICLLIIQTYALALLPLLPVYAGQFGASSTLSGYHLALLYVALFLGTLAAGWVSDKLQRRKETVAICAALVIPLTWAMGLVGQFWQLVALTAAAWFLGGMGMAMLFIIAGLFARRSERGRVFGILAAANSLGTLIAGLASGPIADRWGYPALFIAMALCMAPLLLVAAFFLADRVLDVAAKKKAAAAGQAFGGAFLTYLAACTIISAAGFMSLLGRSLVMKQMGFLASDITLAVAVGGAVGLVLSPLLGRLSDRLGRHQLLAIGCLAGSAGFCLFAVALSAWQFWAGTFLLQILASAVASIAPAFVADLVPAQSLGRGMSLYNATMPAGGIVGFIAMGYLVQGLGGAAAFLLAALLPIVAFAALLGSRRAAA